MPTKKTEKSAPKKVEEITLDSSQEFDNRSSVINRLSQQFNLLAILIVALFLFQAYTFYQVRDLSKNGVAAGGANGGVAGAAGESPLSQDNLIAYAEDLGLDTDAFQSCVESGDTASVVSTDAQEAAGLGVQGTPGFFINGRFLGGAFPFETFKEIIDMEIAGTATGNCSDYSEELQQYCSDPATAAFKPEAVEIAVNDAPRIGAENAAVTIIEYSDFECPFCARAYTTVEQIKDAYPNDVAIVYKHLPLTNLHPNAQKAAEASVCAQQQGKFWEYHDTLFKSQGAA